MCILIWGFRAAVLAAFAAGIYFTTVPSYDYELRSVTDSARMKEYGVSQFFPPTIVDGDTVHFQALCHKQAENPCIFLVEGEKLTPLFTPTSASYVMRGSYGVIGNTSYHQFGGSIVSFRDGKSTTILSHESKAPNGLKFSRFSKIDADGDLVAFCGEYSSGSERGGVFSLKNGRLSPMMGVAQPLKTFEIQEILVSDGQVFVHTDSGLFTGSNDKTTKIIEPGDTVPGGTLNGIRAFCADSGIVAIVANVVQGSDEHEAVLTISDGKVNVVTERWSDGDGYAELGDAVAINSGSVAYIEQTGGRVDLGKHNHTQIPNHRLVVHDGSENHVVVTAGESHFGGTLGSISIGPHGMDAEGNIAFNYYLDTPGPRTTALRSLARNRRSIK